MTVFRHDCGENCGDNCYLKVRWDPNCLGKAYEDDTGLWPFPYPGGKCSATDIDAVLERKGRVLIVENKQGDKKVDTGQRLVFEAFVSMGAMVLVQWCREGCSDSVFRFDLWSAKGIREHTDAEGTRLKRDQLLQKWWAWADKEPA